MRCDSRAHGRVWALISESWVIVGTTDAGIGLSEQGVVTERSRADFPAEVARRERDGGVRWVWSDTPAWYPELLAAGITVRRAYDVRLCHAILRDTAFIDTAEIGRAVAWDAASVTELPQTETLFEFAAPTVRSVPHDLAETAMEFERQRAALGRADARLRLLTAAESAGGLIAAELRAAGLPWDTAEHHRILESELGERHPATGVPRRIGELATEIRTILGDPALSLDSQPKLLRGLHRAGMLVESTSKWELMEHSHPVVAPLLEYKRLTRLMSANGWAWLAEWVDDNRFRPVYLPGGVVTGRWASSGGGALQLPRQLRTAVRPDRGWKFVVADVSQLEPRVLAAMSRDTAMAKAAYGQDLYEGLVSAGVVESRQDAKIAMLGAMYGATSGDAGRLVPRLRKAFPRAMHMVDAAAQTGERGGIVSTLLGRTSPPVDDTWNDVQSRASAPGAGDREQRNARRWSTDRGRFTRNFIVQGTAAEWALAWLADIRNRLALLPPAAVPAVASGPVFSKHAHIAFFLHDEVILHVPEEQADEALAIVAASAEAAGRLLFQDAPVDFRLDAHITDDAAK